MSDTAASPSGQEPSSTGQAPTGQQNATRDETNGNEPQVFPREYVQALRAENAKHRTEAQKRQARIEELESANLTDQQRLQKERDELSQKLAPLELKATRYEVAAEFDIPLSAAGRLQGSNREELVADAPDLKRQLGIGGQEPEDQPDFDAGVRRSTGGRAKGMTGLILDQLGR